MRTLYIDVYFLINFTVDVLALHFAAIFSKIATTKKRIICGGAVGAVAAVITLLLPEYILIKLIFSFLGLLLMAYLSIKPVGAERRMKFVLAFFVFEALIGGGVSLIWGIFDKYLSRFFSSAAGEGVNRKMLFLSLIILVSIGVFKMLVTLFSNIESEEKCLLEIVFFDKKQEVTAFVDSGNLALDPMDLSPVLLIKKELAKTILPENIIELSHIDSLDYAMKKRIRLIPVTRGGRTAVLVGVKADAVLLKNKGASEELRLTLAIDKEGGSFGGYQALMPAAALYNVKS